MLGSNGSSGTVVLAPPHSVAVGLCRSSSQVYCPAIRTLQWVYPTPKTVHLELRQAASKASTKLLVINSFSLAPLCRLGPWMGAGSFNVRVQVIRMDGWSQLRSLDRYSPWYFTACQSRLQSSFLLSGGSSLHVITWVSTSPIPFTNL